MEQAVESIESIPSTLYPPELISLLQEIRGQLKGQNKPASAKFKVIPPLISTVASYKLEMDTEAFMYKSWRAIKKIVRGNNCPEKD